MKKQGLLLILSGPSGSGKGTIVEQLKAKDDFALSISATTRAPRDAQEFRIQHVHHDSGVRGTGRYRKHPRFRHCDGHSVSPSGDAARTQQLPYAHVRNRADSGHAFQLRAPVCGVA